MNRALGTPRRALLRDFIVQPYFDPRARESTTVTPTRRINVI